MTDEKKGKGQEMRGVEIKNEAKPEVKLEVKPEVKLEVKPEVKLEVKLEVKKEAKKLEITVDEIFDNVALGRKEVSLTISHPGLPVPSKKEVTDLLARRLKLPSGDNITISIAGRFGSYRSKASAKVYSDGESMIRIEGGV